MPSRFAAHFPRDVCEMSGGGKECGVNFGVKTASVKTARAGTCTWVPRKSPPDVPRRQRRTPEEYASRSPVRRIKSSVPGLVDQFVGTDPGHHRAQARAGLFDRMRRGGLAGGLELGLAGAVVEHEVFDEAARLDVGQDALHLGLGLGGDDARAVNAGAFVWGDSDGSSLSSTAPDQFIARARGHFFFQSDSTLAPKWYLARVAGSVMACHSRSGVVRM